MFEKARLKLTGWYLLIIMVVSASFSGAIYRIVSQEIDRFAQAQRSRFERRMVILPDGPAVIIVDDDLVREIKKRLLLELLATNSLVFIVSGWLAYLLSGKTLEPIGKMVDEQRRFVSDASHELRTPLTSLKTSMEVCLRDKKLSLVEAKELISENIDEVNKLQSLTENLLELSRFEQPKQLDRSEKVVLSESIEKTLKVIKPLTVKKKIEVSSRIDKNAWIRGNTIELDRLWTILLENAVKYTGMDGQIMVETNELKKSWQVKISDSGVGIAADDLPHIFDRFYRADSARTKTGKDGYGLGLAIAKKIVDAHDAKVSAESEVNKGTTFKLTFRKQN